MNNTKFENLLKILHDEFERNDINPIELATYFSISLIGLLDEAGVTDEDFDRTCEYMKIRFRERRYGLDKC